MIPTPKIVLDNCKVERVIDGDTVTILHTTRMNVRVKDLWAPESRRTSVDGEKALGIRAKIHAERILRPGTNVIVEVDREGDTFGDSLSFGRVVGSVWNKQTGRSFADSMTLTGTCFATKEQLTNYLDTNKQQKGEG